MDNNGPATETTPNPQPQTNPESTPNPTPVQVPGSNGNASVSQNNGAPPGGKPGANGSKPNLGPFGPVVRQWYNQQTSGPNPSPQVLGDATKWCASYGDVQCTINNGSRAIDAGTHDPNVYVAYGAAANQLGDHATANDAGKAALDIDPNNDDADKLYKLTMDRKITAKVPGIGDALKALNQDSFRAATAQANHGSTNFFGAGSAVGGSGGVAIGAGSNMTAAEIAAAAARQAQAPKSNVEQSAFITNQAASDLGLHDYQGAYNLASKAIDLNPRNAQAWNFRAIADNKLSKFSDAVYDASFSLGLAPGNAPALQSRSWAFSKQGKYKEGLADANYTLEKEPNNSYAFQNRAFALAGLGDKDGAIEALRRSAELDPRFKDKLDRAMQAPQESDLMFLFQDEPAAKVAAGSEQSAPGSGAPAKKSFLRLVVLSIAGGLLVALGLLHVVSASWREKVATTMRRVLGADPVEAAGVADTGSAPLTGFWSQYQVLRQIGTGGMGVVYEAKDTTLDRPVAIKKMRDEIRTDPSERQRFVTEARTVAALHHPNIVDIYSIVEDDKDVYLVFEYVDGHTLNELLRDKGALDFDGAVKILRGACEAVDYAHRQKVIHRDIKSSNIMMASDGRVKVMDFGVARQAKDAMTKMSLTNTIVGTPPYMAPEQEQGTVRKESDVFGLGVVFYELLSGKLPFNGSGAGMLLNKINGRHNPLSQQTAQILPAGIDGVIAKALAPDPDKRYRTPAEFLAAVEALAASRA